MMFRPRSFARFARSLRSVELIEPACGRHHSTAADRPAQPDRSATGAPAEPLPPEPPAKWEPVCAELVVGHWVGAGDPWR